MAQNWQVAEIKDPLHGELLRELRMFRRGKGLPNEARIAGLFYLVEALGDGDADQAFAALAQLHTEHGQDPITDIGAYFYLCGWDIGFDSIDERRSRYVEDFYASDVSTPWRRSARGMDQLTTLIRNRSEHRRPWAFVSIFQSGEKFQPVLDFNLAHESWRPPRAFIDEVELDLEFHVHPSSTVEGLYNRRYVLPEASLDTDVTFAGSMASVKVIWQMPIAPLWSLLSWTADPRVMTHMRTFRDRAVEVRLQWWREKPPTEVDGLVTDGAIWAERRDPNIMNLPDGWRIQ